MIILKYIWKAATIFVAAFFIAIHSAGTAPQIIRDNRIQYLNGYPALGRGYNLHSNSLHSVCFQEIAKNDPTFDFKYDMTEINDEYLSHIRANDKNNIEANYLREFVEKYFQETDVTGWGDPVELKNYLVRLQVSNYYFSMNETRSPISVNAKRLIREQNYVNFFNSCGFYYIRSMGSFSSYLAILQFRSDPDNEKKNEDFVRDLEKGLFRFSHSKKEQDAFINEATRRGLKIYVNGIGLSKGSQAANIVPTDLEEFRAVVKNAFTMMQNPSAGYITQMEIVPWFENPEFHVALTKSLTELDDQRKQKKESKNSSINSTAEPNKQKESSASHYLRQRRLEANAGVITEINRVSNLQMEKYHLAMICKRMIYDKFINVWYIHNTRNQPMYDAKFTRFYNRENPNNEEARISLSDFVNTFQKYPPEIFLKHNKSFLYGNESMMKVKIPETTGALRCIHEIFAQGIDSVDSQRIPQCVQTMKYISEIHTSLFIKESQFIRQYCLPQPAELHYNEDGK